MTGIHRSEATVTFHCFNRGLGSDARTRRPRSTGVSPSELAALSEPSLHGALLRALQLSTDAVPSHAIVVAVMPLIRGPCAGCLPVRADGPRGMDGAADAVVVGLAVAGQDQ